MKHKHYDCIVAWAEGKKIERYEESSMRWTESLYPSWGESSKYRIKPELEITYFNLDDVGYWGRREKSEGDNLKLTWNGNKLVNAEVI